MCRRHSLASSCGGPLGHSRAHTTPVPAGPGARWLAATARRLPPRRFPLTATQIQSHHGQVEGPFPPGVRPGIHSRSREYTSCGLPLIPSHFPSILIFDQRTYHAPALFHPPWSSHHLCPGPPFRARVCRRRPSCQARTWRRPCFVRARVHQLLVLEIRLLGKTCRSLIRTGGAATLGSVRNRRCAGRRSACRGRRPGDGSHWLDVRSKSGRRCGRRRGCGRR